MNHSIRIGIMLAVGIALAGCSKKGPPQKTDFAQLLTPLKPEANGDFLSPICTKANVGKHFFVEGVRLELPSSITMRYATVTLTLKSAGEGKDVWIDAENGTDIDSLMENAEKATQRNGQKGYAIDKDTLRVHLKGGGTATSSETLRVTFEVKAANLGKDLKSCSYRFVEAEKL